MTVENIETELYKYHSGKTVDTYKFPGKNERITLRTDRVSANDQIIEGVLIPGKGRVNTALTAFFKKEIYKKGIYNDLLIANQNMILEIVGNYKNFGQLSINEEAISLEIEAIARRYMVGSFVKAFKNKEAWTQGFDIPDLEEYDELPEVIFTPSIKKDTGGDENVSYKEMQEHIKQVLLKNNINTNAFLIAHAVKHYTEIIFNVVSNILKEKGLRLVDIKVEFGLVKINGDYRVILIDEISPDTMRVWMIDSIKPGQIPLGLDKDLVRKEFKEKGTISKETIEKTSKVYLSFGRIVLPPEYILEYHIED